MPTFIENADATQGTILIPKEELREKFTFFREALRLAPQGSEVFYTEDKEREQTIIYWFLKEPDLYRAEQREKVSKAKPCRTGNQEIVKSRP